MLTLLLFATEVLIALHVHDDCVRPYVGDFLVVITGPNAIVNISLSV